MHYQRWRAHGDANVKLVADAGSGTINPRGYRVYKVGGKEKKEHVLVVERILGHGLPSGAVVHHVNGIRNDNRPENLVVCPGRAYHAFLHRRTRAYDACGHVDWRRCVHCGVHGDPGDMKRVGNGFNHTICNHEYQRLARARRKARNVAV